MECIRPLKASKDWKGDITFSSKKADPSIEGFEFPCRKCIACRLNTAREKAIRSFHEAQMHDNSIFLTMTYDEDNLKSDRLDYSDFQKFMKKLRKHNTLGLNNEEKKAKHISYMVTGEYGERTKRPHWHVCLFNYWPKDADIIRTTHNGHLVYRSPTIEKIWNKGMTEFGELTLDSAGYVARYAAKKLVHGKDEEHDYQPIHNTSTKYGLGKKWIEKYWKQTFDLGYVRLPNGEKAKIPRFYTDWLKEKRPEEFKKYEETVRVEIANKVKEKRKKEEMDFLSHIFSRRQKGGNNPWPQKRIEVKQRILESKFKRLQENLKL